MRFESLLAELSSRFISVSLDARDHEIESPQRLVCENLGADLSALWQCSVGGLTIPTVSSSNGEKNSEDSTEPTPRAIHPVARRPTIADRPAN